MGRYCTEYYEADTDQQQSICGDNVNSKYLFMCILYMKSDLEPLRGDEKEKEEFICPLRKKRKEERKKEGKHVHNHKQVILSSTQ